MRTLPLKSLCAGLLLTATALSGTFSTAAQSSKISKSPKTTKSGVQRTSAPLSADPGVTTNCSFLQNPDVIEDPVLHAHELSDLTARVAGQYFQTATNAGAIPRRNFIDEEIFGKMVRDGITSAPLSSDSEFLRRVMLDVTGRIPTLEQVRQFTADTDPDKRNKLISSLIGSPEYVDRWTMWLGDHLQNNAFNDVPRYFEGRNALHKYIRENVAKNRPYNEFVTELLTTNGNSFQSGPANYMTGSIAAMGPQQDTYDLAAVHSAKRFLGIETMDCLMCHDGQGHLESLNVWASKATRMQGWKMSAFFSRMGIRNTVVNQQPFTVTRDLSDINNEYRLNTNSGNRTNRQPVNGVNTVMPEYIFTGGRVLPGESYRAAFARMLTRDRQFARATVNYLWAHYFGLGIVDPPTNFDLARLDPKNPPADPWTIQPSHPELLEKLATEFIDSNYNLQHVMRLIVQSSAYQLSSRYPGEWKDAYATYFARKLVRRLDSEEVHDAVTQATGVGVTFQVYGYSENFQRAMQLPDTVEPSGYGGVTVDATAAQSRTFLNTFGRGNRFQEPRSNTASILQGLTMMNNAFVINRTRAAANGSVARLLAARSGDDRGLVEDMFLSTLSRRPTDAEMTQSLTMLRANRTRGAEDLMWMLLNKIDFLYNY